MNAASLVPAGYDLVHWIVVVAFVFVEWEILKWLRSKIKA